MKFNIDHTVLNQFPRLNIGVIIAANCSNKGADEKIYPLLEEVETLIKNNFTPEKVATHKLISPWKAALYSTGKKPHHIHSSVESLMHVILKEGTLPRTNKLLDLYRYMSLKYLTPIAAADLHHIVGDLTLGKANGTEFFVSVEGDTGREHPKKGEVIYSDRLQVVNRQWDAHVSYKTRITENTSDAILCVEGLPPLTKGDVDHVAKELQSLLETFLGASCTRFMLNAEQTEIEF